MAVCGRCNAQVPDQIGPCPNCGTMVNPFTHAATGPAYGQPGPYAPGQYPAANAYPPGQDPNYHGLIPYKNTYALLAYYVGIFGMFPCVPVLAIGALVLGIMGLREYKRDPSVKGVVHAWIGIVLGAGATLLYGAISILILIAALNAPRR
jgi:hypothetical protein